MSRPGALITIAALIALLASACGGPPEASPQVNEAWRSCEAEPAVDATSPLPRLDDSFTPVTAIVCFTGPARRADGGESQVATESRADDITSLLAALRLKDERRTNGACTLELPVIPRLVLLDRDGRWITPGIPQDSCGKVRVEVRRAVGDLRLTPVSSRPVRELESAEAARTGCGQHRADMIGATIAMGTRSGSKAGLLPAGAGAVRMCVYRVPADQQGSGKPAGDFLSGRALSGREWAAAKAAIENAPAAKGCTTHAGRFAVLLTGGDDVYVELDGCERLLAGSFLGQSSRALQDLLAKSN
jgi:hypothetical protein